MCKKNLTINLTLFLLFVTSLTISAQNCSKVVVGYWHSWQNPSAPFIKLRDVPCSFNVVILSFLESTSPSDPTMVFRMEEEMTKSKINYTNDDLIADIRTLKAKGIKVMVSVGGAAGYVALLSDADKKKFIESTSAFIDKFGVEGLDIDIEGGGVVLGAEDSDLKNPKSPRLVNLISAIHTLKAKYGAGFWITMAPEFSYAQGGITAYGGSWGSYLPLIYGCRDILEFLHVQYYNGGGNLANDGNTYQEGTADFIVAMSDMLLSGFKVGSQTFPALQPRQVSFGIPATTGAANGGVISMSAAKSAIDYIRTGASYGGRYKLSKTYPEFRGSMAWSVNWDAVAGYQYSRTFSQTFCGTTNLCAAVSVPELNQQKTSVTIFPNPATNQLTIASTVPIQEIEIYSTSGRLVERKTAATPLVMDISEFPTGIYLVRVLTENNSFTQRISKY